VANLNGGRHRAIVEPEWAGAILPQRQKNDGGGDHDATKFRLRQPPDAIRGRAVYACSGALLLPISELRRVSRWPAILDDYEGKQTANQRRAELVRRIEASRAIRKVKAVIGKTISHDRGE